MITFITWVACIGVAIASLVWLAVVCVILARIGGYKPTRYALPPPDRAAERMYGVQYFIRAIGRK